VTVLPSQLLAIVAALCVGVSSSAQDSSHPPVTPSPPLEAVGLNRSLLRFIEDDAPVRNERENHDEALAFDSVVSYAHRVPEESFHKSARRDLTFVHLLGKEANQYRGEVVEVQGRLVRNLDVGPTPALKADGIEHMYEAYIKSDKHPGYAWCVFHTEQSLNLPVGEGLNLPVTCCGYFFKVYAYREQGKSYRMPLLISRSIEPRAVTPLPASLVDEALLSLPMLIALLVAAFVMILGLVLWFRLADARTRRRIQQAHRTSANGAEPVVFHNAIDDTPALSKNG
jgi:hypothetical protein